VLRKLAVLVEDPDAPGGIFVHWVAWGIDPSKGVSQTVFALSEALDLPPGASSDDLRRAVANRVIAEGRLTGGYARA
jgi:phosphatidylethanolamine-binding protein (PEBP) family uncharacterized protein